jgi:hypothetical protein
VSYTRKMLVVALLSVAWLGSTPQALQQAPGKETGKPAQRGSKPVARQVPTPASVIGWEPGTDQKIADTAQVVKYFQALAAAAPDRTVLTEIGKSGQGRPIQLLAISSEANIKRLARYKEISHRLAMAKNLTDQEAEKLVQEGKAVIVIEHGKDGSEPAPVESAQRLAYHLVTSDDPEVRLIRENVIVLIVPCQNPDGRESFLRWYQKTMGTEYALNGTIPWLDHPYTGHEGNRDMVMLSMPEQQAVATMSWQEWNPQIFVDMHQGVPYPARIFIPPYQEPLNPALSPVLVRGISVVGSAMAMRFEREGKPGVIARATYTQWGDAAVRETNAFHNAVTILVETQERPATWATPGFTSPESIPDSFGIPTAGVGLVPNAPSVFYPNPWMGGKWTYKDQVDYVYTAAMGALVIGAQLKNEWLHNMFLVAKGNIEKGKKGNPFAFVIPPEQWDGGGAIELVNTLRRGAIEVHRATAPFTAGGKSYPAGTYIAFAGQAFWSSLTDVMQPQRHPDLRAYPGGPPIPPYDQAAWTLPMELGVQVDRIDLPFDAQVQLDTTPVFRRGAVKGQGPVYLLSTRDNASFRALNKLWGAGLQVSRAHSAVNVGGQSWPIGTFVVRGDAAKLGPIAESLGVDFVGVADIPQNSVPVAKPRVGLYQSWQVTNHNPDEGWTRWILEDYGFDYKTLRDQDVRTGDLSGFSAIILSDQESFSIVNGFAPGAMPPEYVGGIGAEGSANLKRFIERGGTLIMLSGANTFAIQQLGVPIRNSVESVPSTALYAPGSFLRGRVDTTHPLAWGMQPEVPLLYFRRGAPQQLVLEVVKPGPGGEKQVSQAVSIAAWFGDRNLLLSGWEVGADRYMAGTPALVQVKLGSGSAVLINFRTQWRGQTRGTFKFLFNSILMGGTEKPLS